MEGWLGKVQKWEPPARWHCAERKAEQEAAVSRDVNKNKQPQLELMDANNRQSLGKERVWQEQRVD